MSDTRSYGPLLFVSLIALHAFADISYSVLRRQGHFSQQQNRVFSPTLGGAFKADYYEKDLEMNVIVPDDIRKLQVVAALQEKTIGS